MANAHRAAPTAIRRTDGAKRLYVFLEKNGIPYSVAGAALGVSRVTAFQWCTGAKRPIEDNRIALEKWTGGAVPRDSWRTKSEAPRPIEPFKASPDESGAHPAVYAKTKAAG